LGVPVDVKDVIEEEEDDEDAVLSHSPRKKYS
jgi:hypothetical protein